MIKGHTHSLPCAAVAKHLGQRLLLVGAQLDVRLELHLHSQGKARQGESLGNQLPKCWHAGGRGRNQPATQGGH